MTAAGAAGRTPLTSRGARAAATAAVVALVAAGCSSQDAAPPPAGGAGQGVLELPGDDVFPEGVAVDPATGTLYVGSTTDGTVYRADLDAGDGEPTVEEFLPGDQDGRTAATGMEVDEQGRLWVAGRTTGRVFVHDATTGELVRALQTPPAERTLINDLTFTPDAAFVTDSFRPVLWRVDRSADDVGTEMEPWLDLSATIVPTDTTFGLNGIAASDDGGVLLTVHFDTGRLFRVDVATREVTEVDLGGDLLTTGDGILLDGQDLLVVREKPGGVYPVRLTEDLTSGEVGEPFGEDLLLPTTLAEHDGEVLVVNSQLNDQDSPELPFTVARIPVPDDLGLDR